MEITKKQIKQLDKGEKTVRELFPDVFEKFTGWAKTDELDNEKYLAYFEKNILKYGFNGIGKWFVCEYKPSYNYNYVTEYPATYEEVKTALIEEAKMRGFKKGVFAKWAFEQNEKGCLKKEIENLVFSNKMITDGWGHCIFYNGKWAEIVEEKTALDLLNEIIDASENNAYVRNKAKKAIELLTKNLTVNDAEIIKN